MSRTFMRRELRRQAPAGLGRFLLSLFLLVGVGVFTRGHHLEAIVQFCFILTPALLGVYAFGPDLEMGQERFLTVLPLSRPQLGALRLGIAAGVVIAVDASLVAVHAGMGNLGPGRVDNLAESAAFSLLLVPLGALAAVTLRHTLGALGTVLVLLVSAPALDELLGEFLYVQLNDGLVAPTLLVGWTAAALWLYGRARSMPQLKAAIPLGLAAFAIGLAPLPAFGAYNYLTHESEWATLSRSAQRPSLQPAPRGDAFSVRQPHPDAHYQQAVGVLRSGETTPILVGYGESHWLGDCLIATQWTGALDAYWLASDTHTRFSKETKGVQSPDKPRQSFFSNRLAHHSPVIGGLLVDRVGDDLLAIPASSRSGSSAPTFRSRHLVERAWKEEGYAVRNLTQGTTWSPPVEAVVQTLANGWALLRDPEERTWAMHVLSGASFDPQSDLPAELRSSWLQLLRVEDRAILIGMTDTLLWWQDLDQPSSHQRVSFAEIGSVPNPESPVTVYSQGNYMTLTWADDTLKFFSWELDGSSQPVETPAWPSICGPQAGQFLISGENDAGEVVLRRTGRPDVLVDLESIDTNSSSMAFSPAGEALVIEVGGQVYGLRDSGELVKRFVVAQPSDWRQTVLR